MYYKYETHLHTAEGSACCMAGAAEQRDFYANMGYTGVIVTDHFFNGNTTVTEEGLSWEEMVERFCLGYYNALEAGKERGIDVLFGWEYTYEGADLLTYGFTPEWLLEHPIVMELSPWDYCNYIREKGGLIIHAHPFRFGGHIGEIKLNPRSVDGVEVFNACSLDFENKMAEIYAKRYRLRRLSGSDNHLSYAMGRLGGIKSKFKIENSQDFVSLIKRGNYKTINERITK